MTYSDFTNLYATPANLKASNTARHIFEDIIGRPDNLMKMMVLSDFDIPALAACAKEIEACAKGPNSDLPLGTDGKGNPCLEKQLKQYCGKFVKAWMERLGYVPYSDHNRLPARLMPCDFKTATSYRRQEGKDPSIKLEIHLIEASADWENL